MNGASFIIFTIAVFILILFLYWITILWSHLFARRGRHILYRDFYECGFRMVPDLRFLLDIQFSILGIIFLVYDMEIVLLTPLLVNLLQLPNIVIVLVLLILTILTISYWFEWEHHTLHWSLL